MSIKKHIQTVPMSKLKSKSNNFVSIDYNNTASKLPQVYTGSPIRLERYRQYDEMDCDSDINNALDTISNFSTKTDNEENLPFEIKYNGEASDSEMQVINESLKQWCKLNEFRKRMWRIFRNTLKYGDQVFVRDPETLKLISVSADKIEKVIVDEAKGKEPEAYVFTDLDVNLQTLTMNQTMTYGQNLATSPTEMPYIRNTQQYANQYSNSVTNGRFSGSQQSTAIDATHIVHLSLTEGLDANWPFGTSILESVYKTWREKGLLEQAIIIYRIQRAPERRVFYVDVGDMALTKVPGYLERVKNEMHQKRYPSRTGNGTNIGDTTYDAQSINEDFFLSVSTEGRGSKIDVLPGGQNLGDIDDLRVWSNKLLRGLRVPSSYIPTGPDDNTMTYTDGRTGTAYIQEYIFSQYCIRLQNLLQPTFDSEFKLFLKQRGCNISSAVFELEFNTPENFSLYEQIERDSAAIGLFTQINDVSFLSKRFIMKKYLNLSEDEIAENEKLLLEEMDEGEDTQNDEENMVGLNSIGIRPSFDVEDDFTDDEESIENNDASAVEDNFLGQGEPNEVE